ncbi:hypothetical protein J2Y55_004611 [Bosea sp. BE125]|uniref:hypothetical protein n=1 Tax=Bosea sp. BE125 TaxID=2817909 RepID=UPI0028613763|nr:hypothetical protein [Bosea sp. BE125]MDR6873584.1 hypothetical protein [Bosea sp. BE125]
MIVDLAMERSALCRLAIDQLLPLLSVITQERGGKLCFILMSDRASLPDAGVISSETTRSPAAGFPCEVCGSLDAGLVSS